MLKERIQEVFEFTKSESPYRKANKGWINQDIFLDLSPSTNTLKKRVEDAKVTLFWPPINSLLSNIFIIIILGSILVFTSLSFVKGKFDFNLFNTSSINDILNVEDGKILNINNLNDLDSLNYEFKEENDNYDLDETNNVNSADDNKLNLEQEIIIDKLDDQGIKMNDIPTKEDIEVLKSNKSKSNFI